MKNIPIALVYFSYFTEDFGKTNDQMYRSELTILLSSKDTIAT